MQAHDCRDIRVIHSSPFLRPFLLPFSTDFFQFSAGRFVLSLFLHFSHIRIGKGEKPPVKNGGKHKKPPKKGNKKGSKKSTVNDPIEVMTSEA